MQPMPGVVKLANVDACLTARMPRPRQQPRRRSTRCWLTSFAWRLMHTPCAEEDTPHSARRDGVVHHRAAGTPIGLAAAFRQAGIHVPNLTSARSTGHHPKAQSSVCRGCPHWFGLSARSCARHHVLCSSAFANHYPLAIAPDDIWLLLAEGLAAHIRKHAQQGAAMTGPRRCVMGVWV